MIQRANLEFHFNWNRFHCSFLATATKKWKTTPKIPNMDMMTCAGQSNCSPNDNWIASPPGDMFRFHPVSSSGNRFERATIFPFVFFFLAVDSTFFTLQRVPNVPICVRRSTSAIEWHKPRQREICVAMREAILTPSSAFQMGEHRWVFGASSGVSSRVHRGVQRTGTTIGTLHTNGATNVHHNPLRYCHQPGIVVFMLE